MPGPSKATDYFMMDEVDDGTGETELSETREPSPKLNEEIEKVPLLSSEEEYQKLLKEASVNPKKWTVDQVIEFLILNGCIAHVEAFRATVCN